MDDKMDYEALARKYLGPEYKNMTPQERLEQTINSSPYSWEEKQAALGAVRGMPSEVADDITRIFLESYEALHKTPRTLGEIIAPTQRDKKAD